MTVTPTDRARIDYAADARINYAAETLRGVARFVAVDYHGGQTSALYALASSGWIDPYWCTREFKTARTIAQGIVDTTAEDHERDDALDDLDSIAEILDALETLAEAIDYAPAAVALEAIALEFETMTERGTTYYRPLS